VEMVSRVVVGDTAQVRSKGPSGAKRKVTDAKRGGDD
jgi:hypothetical protein